MSSITEIRRKHNKKTVFSDGKMKTYGEMTSEKMKEENSYLNSLEEKFKITPMELSFEELNYLRQKEYSENGRKGYKGDRVNLVYKNGFVMASNDSLDMKRKMSLTSRGIVDEVSHITNPEGFLVYGNDKPIQSLTDLNEYLKKFDITPKTWKDFQVCNKNFNIIKKEKVDNVWYLILNPIFNANAYQLTYFKFLTFGKSLKECGYLSELDYVFLCKTHRIVPENS